MRAVLLCGLVLAFAVGCDKVKTVVAIKPDVTADTIPETWTHRELLDHLATKGAKIRSVPTNRGFMVGPAVFIVAQDAPYTTDEEADKAYDEKKTGVAASVLFKTPQDAKDFAGSKPGRWACGRFAFAGDAALIAEIKKCFQ